ncbi:MFS transporter [Nocardia rhizosphaerihabitans]|uniref:MFS transporter n=1 Tax=Nocardia rhizosphaerihabitans TaxID=1691570 RepID=UPI00366CED32
MSSPATTETWAPTGRTVATICAVGILVVGQLYVVLPILGDLAAVWGTSRAAATWTTTAFGLAYGAGFLVTGPLSDRWGRRPVIVAGLAATSVSTLVVIAAPNLGAGLAARILQGLTASFFAPAAFAYLAERIAPARRVFALTCLTSSFLGAGVIAQVLAQVVDDAFGWRTVFVAGAVGFALSAVVLHVVLEPGRDRGTAPASGSASSSESTSASESRRGSVLSASASKVVAGFATLLRTPRLALLYLSCLAVLGSFVGIYTGVQLTPPDGIGTSSTALLALRASAIPAMIAIPLLATRLAVINPELRLVTALSAAGAAAAITAVPLGGIWVAVWLFVFVAAVAIAAPAAVQAIAAQAGEARGAATALYTFALFLGASAGPQLANLVAGNGFTAVALVIAALGFGGAALAFASTRVQRSPGQVSATIDPGNTG